MSTENNALPAPLPAQAEPLRGNRFPGGNRFAFSILDDTDDSTLEKARPVYDLLHELGFRTTKTVWANDCPPERQGPFFAAETLRDPDYLAYHHQLADRGFEIAFHNATMGSSTREEIVEALAFLEGEFGAVPKLHANHGLNRDNLYWGPDRYRTPGVHALVALVARLRKAPPYEGATEGSPYFWGDLCREYFRFVRGHAFARVDTAGLPPGVPYHDPTTPWVNAWFTTSDAPDVRYFNRLITPESMSALAHTGGVCIVSTHLGKGFVRDGAVDARFASTLRHIAQLPGWFAPVSDILEHQQGGSLRTIGPVERVRLEIAHFFDRIAQRLSPPHVPLS